MHLTEDSMKRRRARSFLLHGVVVLAGSALVFSSCTRRESFAERHAEIERQVQLRLEAEHQAEERDRLAQRQAALEAREKTLAAQESSFATLVASNAPDAAAAPLEAGADYSAADSYVAADSYSNYPIVTDQYYPEDYGYVSPNEPLLAPDPYFFPPTTSVVSIVNQNAQIVFLQRNRARAGRNHHRPNFPSQPGRGGGRPGGAGRHVRAGTPIRTTARPPTRAAAPRLAINSRPISRSTAQGSRRVQPRTP